MESVSRSMRVVNTLLEAAETVLRMNKSKKTADSGKHLHGTEQSITVLMITFIVTAP